MEVLWAGVGAGLSKLLDLVLDVTAKTMEFNSELNGLESILKLLQPVVREIAKLDAELDVPREETEGLTKKLKEGLELVGKCSEIKFYKAYYYSKKIDKYADSVWKFFQIYLQALQTRDNKKILVLMKNGTDGKMSELVAKQKGKMKANKAGSSNIDPADDLDTDETEVNSDSDGCETTVIINSKKKGWAMVSGYVDPIQERWKGLLIINILSGKNLAIRDRFIKRSSDPYVIVEMGEQKVKTKVVKRNINPEWNEVLTLCVIDTSLPIKLEVYDKDHLNPDDKIGDAAIDIEPFLEAMKNPYDSIVEVKPGWDNCLAEESPIFRFDGKVVQYMLLKLRNVKCVKCGLVDLQLHWIDAQIT